VDEAVVDQRVDHAVAEHAEAEPGARPPGVLAHDPRRTEREQRDAQRGADEAEQVVLLEHAAMRFVVVAVPGPGEAMHHVLMARPRDPFHRRQRGERDQCGNKPGHAAKYELWPIKDTPA
jgi:hypothetical protein